MHIFVCSLKLLISPFPSIENKLILECLKCGTVQFVFCFFYILKLFYIFNFFFHFYIFSVFYFHGIVFILQVLVIILFEIDISGLISKFSVGWLCNIDVVVS